MVSFIITKILYFNQLTIIKMKVTSKLSYWSSKLLRKLDLFPTSNFIRYNAEGQYTTATGGLVSLTVIIIFAVLFASMGLRTVQRKIIQSSVETSNDLDPPPLVIKTSPENNFMFAVSLFGFDLSNTTFKLFDITLWQTFYGPGYSLINETVIPLSPCTLEHFDFGPNVKSVFYKFNMTKSLCLPLNHQFQVGGKAISDLQSIFSIVVSPCNSTVDPSCVSSGVLSGIEAVVKKFTLIVPVINVQLNPGSEDYKSYYLQDRNYFQFDSSMGMGSVANLQQAVVHTDVSIMPFEDIKTQYFTVLPQLFTNTPYLMSPSSPYAKVTFNKAQRTTTYNRSFNKVDAYFSYVGGLIGTIIGLVFILNIYTKKAYEINISHKLFKDSKGEEINSSSFNILYFFAMIIKSIINFCKCRVDWSKTQTFIDCCDEISFQLDITYILKKVMFLQTAVELLFDKQHYEALHFKQKYSINQVKKKRKKHFCRQQLSSQDILRDLGQSNKVQNQEMSQQSMVGKNVTLNQNSQLASQMFSKIEDVSDLSLSNSGRENEVLKRNIIKVMKEGRRGDKLSQKVMQKLDKQLNQEYFMDEESKQQQKDVNQIAFVHFEKNEMKQARLQSEMNQHQQATKHKTQK